MFKGLGFKGFAKASTVLHGLGSLGILCKSLLVAMAKELEQRALQALLPHLVCMALRLRD